MVIEGYARLVGGKRVCIPAGTDSPGRDSRASAARDRRTASGSRPLSLLREHRDELVRHIDGNLGISCGSSRCLPHARLLY